MRKTLVFASRNTKEIIRDPISIFFGVAFPIVLLLLLSFINRNIPAEAEMSLFEIGALAPAIAVFSLSFLTLFSAMLISKDCGSSLFLRLLTSPLKSADFIIGYALPLLPMALAQTVICIIAALPLGLNFSPELLMLLPVNLPIALVNISVGIICGTLFSEKAVGGICGALFTNISAWLSGIWFSLDLVGGAFKKIAYRLPFAHAVDAARAAAAGDFSAVLQDLLPVILWAVALTAAAITIFKLKVKAN